MEICWAGFSNITTLKEVKIPNTIKSGAFEDCINLQKIVIPENVTFLGYELFMNCEKLNSITLNCQIDKISYKMFEGCKSL